MGQKDNFTRTLNLGQQQAAIVARKQNEPVNSAVLACQHGPAASGMAGGAIVLSYSAAMTPQIQINNISNLNLINNNMKKKLNHEAY
jgi:hypothetical protein